MTTTTDELLEHAARYAAEFDRGDLPKPPRRRVAIVTCMDARINPYGIFGLTEGDAHVVRNAGGAVTEDARRALAISQRLLGTEEIVLVHHADCGMRGFRDEAFRDEIERETGVRPAWSPDAYPDSSVDVAASLALVRADPFIPHRDKVRGFVYDERTGTLTEVS